MYDDFTDTACIACMQYLFYHHQESSIKIDFEASLIIYNENLLPLFVYPELFFFQSYKDCDLVSLHIIHISVLPLL